VNVQGKFWVIACKVSESVSEIKDRIKDKMGIDSERQILVFKGVQLQDTQKLEDCDVVDGATVHLVTRPGIARMPQQTSASSASMRNREPQASRVSKAQGAASSGDDAPLLPLPSRKHAQTSRGREAARDAPALNAGGQQAGGGGGSRAKREARIGAGADGGVNHVGARVEMHGMTRAEAYNGLVGTVRSVLDGGRLGVEVDTLGRVISVKPENLRLFVGYEEDQAGRKLKPTPKPSQGTAAPAPASSVAADSGKGASAPPCGGAAVDENNECVVCMDAPRQCAFVPCGHMCVCKSCSDVIIKMEGSSECPMCCGQVQSVLVIYNV